MASGAGGPNARPALAGLVAILHMAIVLFFTVGWVLPWNVAHWLVIGGGLLLPLIWALFDNDCPLTRLERRLAGNTRNPEPQDQPYFVSRLLSRMLGRTVSNQVGNRVIHAVLLWSMLICAARLTL